MQQFVSDESARVLLQLACALELAKESGRITRDVGETQDALRHLRRYTFIRGWGEWPTDLRELLLKARKAAIVNIHDVDALVPPIEEFVAGTVSPDSRVHLPDHDDYWSLRDDDIAPFRQPLLRDWLLEGLWSFRSRVFFADDDRPQPLRDGAGTLEFAASGGSPGGVGRRGGHLARGRAAHDEKSELKPWLRKGWCIPQKQNAEFVAHMEDVLEVYHHPYDATCPVICMDEMNKQLIGEVRPPQAGCTGRAPRYDVEYLRRGTANVPLPSNRWQADGRFV